MTDPRRADLLGLPPHVGVLVGLSAGAYALVLAGVAGVQSADEAALRAERAPTVARLEALQAGHDALLDRVEAARLAYERGVGAYGLIGDGLGGYEDRLSGLAATVTGIAGAAAALPDRVSLPPIRTTVRAVQAPATQTTTGASGG